MHTIILSSQQQDNLWHHLDGVNEAFEGRSPVFTRLMDEVGLGEACQLEGESYGVEVLLNGADYAVLAFQADTHPDASWTPAVRAA